MCAFTLESTHFIFNKSPCIYTHDGASAKFSTNPHKTDYTVHGWDGMAGVQGYSVQNPGSNCPCIAIL
jgi:hypothetical protein